MAKREKKKAPEGPEHGMWKGGSKSTDAYRARKAWEKYWGKKVPDGYVIAHKDGNPENNHISNLKLMTLEAHNRLHKKGKKIKDWGKGIKNKPNIGHKDGVQRRFRK
ncbi:MAG: HNH endonuclease [Deltaproteobacteria bacterium]|nr:HNH endonuclease [Deltaproteobacteria bacterium]